VLARGVAHCGATNIFSPAQRPRSCCKKSGGRRCQKERIGYGSRKKAGNNISIAQWELIEYNKSVNKSVADIISSPPFRQCKRYWFEEVLLSTGVSFKKITKQGYNKRSKSTFCYFLHSTMRGKTVPFNPNKISSHENFPPHSGI
jgi:hypothetical protein